MQLYRILDDAYDYIVEESTRILEKTQFFREIIPYTPKIYFYKVRGKTFLGRCDRKAGYRGNLVCWTRDGDVRIIVNELLLEHRYRNLLRECLIHEFLHLLCDYPRGEDAHTREFEAIIDILTKDFYQQSRIELKAWKIEILSTFQGN
jgi:hypothetical protein